jgi:hypothetical protein
MMQRQRNPARNRQLKTRGPERHMAESKGRYTTRLHLHLLLGNTSTEYRRLLRALIISHTHVNNACHDTTCQNASAYTPACTCALPTESLDPSFFHPPASSRAPYAIAVDNALSICTYCSISDHWREFNTTRTDLKFALADHLGWTVHCVGILVHLTAGRGETFTHHTGETVTSPSRDGRHHSHIDEMQLLKTVTCDDTRRLSRTTLLSLSGRHHPLVTSTRSAEDSKTPGTSPSQTAQDVPQFVTFLGSTLADQRNERSAYY